MVDEVIALDQENRNIKQEVESLRANKNKISKQIGALMGQGKKEEAEEVKKEVAASGAKLMNCLQEKKEVEEKNQNNHDDNPEYHRPFCPGWKRWQWNPEVRRWGEIRKFPFPAKEHYELGENLGILDSERAGKVSGARFYFYFSMAARLERAVYNFMLDVHTQQNDFTEVIPPYIINGASMQGTGQLPKFEDDMYKVEGENMYMTPTAEVPLTNYFSGEF